jgi:Bifunctional DNA primase/polymerase, N-terminal/AAA domain
MSQGPYALAAPSYRELGWLNPLPVRGKILYLKGYTGRDGADLTDDDVRELIRTEGTKNVAIRLPANAIGIDIDDGYPVPDGSRIKAGAETIARAEAEFGKLPPTYSITARGPGQLSRIRLYRVPTGMHWWDAEFNLAHFGLDVDILHRGYRYFIAPPSKHPETGKLYSWYGVDGKAVAVAPRPDDLPELPEAWLEFLTAQRQAPASRNGDRPEGTGRAYDVAAFLERNHLGIRKEGPLRNGGYVWELEPCPYNPEHNRGEAHILQCVSGAVVAGCHHNSCKRDIGWGWDELRARYADTEPKTSPRDTYEPPPPSDADAPPEDNPQASTSADSEPETAGEIRPFPVSDLAKLAREGVEPPEQICDDMLYRGCLHSLGGDSGHGKTTLLDHWALQELKASRSVVILDEEDGQKSTVRRLLALGAEPDWLERLVYLDSPGRQWDEADRRGFEQLLNEYKPRLIGYCSALAILTAAGKNENYPTDITPIYKLLSGFSREHNAAGVLVDHVPIGDTTRTRGAGAKRQWVDVQYMLQAVKPFNRFQSGLLKLTISKDREGYLHRAYEIKVEVKAGTMGLAFSKIEGVTDGPLAGLSPAARKVYAVLPTSLAPATIRELIDAIAREFGHGLQRVTVSEALNEMASRDLCDSMGEPGKEKRWWKL